MPLAAPYRTGESTLAAGRIIPGPTRTPGLVFRESEWYGIPKSSESESGQNPNRRRKNAIPLPARSQTPTAAKFFTLLF